MANASYAVMKTVTGMRSTPMASMTSNPSSSGISTSSKTTSGGHSSIAATASLPDSHSPTISTSDIRSRRTRNPRRASGSSSTMSTRNGSLMIRQIELDAQAAECAAIERHALVVAVEVAEALTRVRETDTSAVRAIAARRQPGTVVLDGEAQPLTRAPPRQRDATAASARSDRVTYRILDDGLKDERWNTSVANIGIDLDVQRQFVAETHLLDVEVAL